MFFVRNLELCVSFRCFFFFSLVGCVYFMLTHLIYGVFFVGGGRLCPMPAYSIFGIFIVDFLLLCTFYTLNLFRAGRLSSTEIVPNRTRNGTRLIALHTRRVLCRAKRHVFFFFLVVVYSIFPFLRLPLKMEDWIYVVGVRSSQYKHIKWHTQITAHLNANRKKMILCFSFRFFLCALMRCPRVCSCSAQFHSIYIFHAATVWESEILLRFKPHQTRFPHNLMHINDCAFLRPSERSCEFTAKCIRRSILVLGNRWTVNYISGAENAATHLTITILYFIYWP